jgi:hypothetical protein
MSTFLTKFVTKRQTLPFLMKCQLSTFLYLSNIEQLRRSSKGHDLYAPLASEMLRKVGLPARVVSG